ncbi:MAG: hypothetical protein Q8865_02805 [Bacillota bacterium]|nr:hypothetical protein [Bacillota bacterium]
MAADGVSLGWVDVKTSKSTIIPRTDFALLPFDGNVRIIENSTTKVAVSAGFGKNIGEDKKAGIYDTEKKAFNPISDTNLVSAYPATSADGKTFYYSAMQKGSAKANEFKGTRLYKVPAAGGKSDKFTQDSDFSDYAPVPVNGSVLFARQAKDMSLSIWTTKGGEPKKIADNVKALTNYYEYGYYNFDKIFTIHK